MVVFDITQGTVGVVRSITPKGIARIERPAGWSWDTSVWRLRPGTPREHRQLVALARLYRQMQRT
ncbi:hypothetical protein [Streptomyces sp. NPDC057244]